MKKSKFVMAMYVFLAVTVALGMTVMAPLTIRAEGNSNAELYYWNDFENGFDDQFEWFDWELTSDDDSSQYAYMAEEGFQQITRLELEDTYSDLDILYRVRLDSVNSDVDANFGVSLRRANGGNDQLDVAYQAVSKRLRVISYKGGAPTTLGIKDCTLETDKWVLMGFRLQGTKLQWYVDGELMMEVEDNVHTEGTMLFAAYNANISIDDIIITSPGGIDMVAGKALVEKPTPSPTSTPAPATPEVTESAPNETQAPTAGNTAPATQNAGSTSGPSTQTKPASSSQAGASSQNGNNADDKNDTLGIIIPIVIIVVVLAVCILVVILIIKKNKNKNKNEDKGGK